MLSFFKLFYSRLWEPRENSDSWCAGAYIINKVVMKPYIDSMIKKLTNGWIGVSVTAGTCYERYIL
jgi:hypothetical protein